MGKLGQHELEAPGDPKESPDGAAC